VRFRSDGLFVVGVVCNRLNGEGWDVGKSHIRVHFLAPWRGGCSFCRWLLLLRRLCWRCHRVLDSDLHLLDKVLSPSDHFGAYSPITTVPGYVAARSMNFGPKVNEAGASSGDATEYVTYAEEEASYLARSLFAINHPPHVFWTKDSLRSSTNSNRRP
jgi:hypothetical protein